jgi:zeaxanthin glucosyltransferase
VKHFGIICPPVPGHLNPFLALARELQRRGHRGVQASNFDGTGVTDAATLELAIEAANVSRTKPFKVFRQSSPIMS